MKSKIMYKEKLGGVVLSSSVLGLIPLTYCMPDWTGDSKLTLGVKKKMLLVCPSVAFNR